MRNSFQQNLPDLLTYRSELVSAGAVFPLQLVPSRPDGLLSAIPAPKAGLAGWPWNVQTPPFAGLSTNWPRITVVIPSFQQGAYVEETLRSVLLQNYPLLECIVMDGGSTDETRAVIQKYQPWLSFARVARDRGQAHAINLGFSIGSGTLFGWLNSDDLYLPGALRRVAEAWMKTGAEFIYGDALDLDQSTGKFSYATSHLAADRYVKFPGIVPSHATFWASSRNRPVWEEQTCALDYELWIRLLPGLRKSHIRWPLGVFRRHMASKSFDAKTKERWADDALRNGMAHPELYRAGLSSRLLNFEFNVVQRFSRSVRRRDLQSRMASLRRECAWDSAVLAER